MIPEVPRSDIGFQSVNPLASTMPGLHVGSRSLGDHHGQPSLTGIHHPDRARPLSDPSALFLTNPGSDFQEGVTLKTSENRRLVLGMIRLLSVETNPP